MKGFDLRRRAVVVALVTSFIGAAGLVYFKTWRTDQDRMIGPRSNPKCDEIKLEYVIPIWDAYDADPRSHKLLVSPTGHTSKGAWLVVSCSDDAVIAKFYYFTAALGLAVGWELKGEPGYEFPAHFIFEWIRRAKKKGRNPRTDKVNLRVERIVQRHSLTGRRLSEPAGVSEYDWKTDSLQLPE